MNYRSPHLPNITIFYLPFDFLWKYSKHTRSVKIFVNNIFKLFEIVSYSIHYIVYIIQRRKQLKLSVYYSFSNHLLTLQVFNIVYEKIFGHLWGKINSWLNVINEFNLCAYIHKYFVVTLKKTGWKNYATASSAECTRKEQIINISIKQSRVKFHCDLHYRCVYIL